MNRDEIRKLIGGYATGSLTEAERKMLFDLALEDQELFDELSREQELKELLDEPGAKQRLIAALKPQPKLQPWWTRPWPWAAAATLALGVVISIVMLRHPAQVKQEVAGNAQPAAVSSAPSAAPSPAPPESVVSHNPPPAVKKVSGTLSQSPKTAPVNRMADARTDGPKSENLKKDKDATLAAADRVEVTAAAPVISQQANAPPAPQQQLPKQLPSPTDQNGQTPQGAGAVASSGSRMRAASVRKPSSFGFDYAVKPDGTLTVTPEVDGYLAVESADIRLVHNERAKAGAAIVLEIPVGAQSVSITFSASQDPPVKAAIERVQPSGSVSEANLSPTSNLRVVIRLK